MIVQVGVLSNMNVSFTIEPRSREERSRNRGQDANRK
jgi:hypothetical protein